MIELHLEQGIIYVGNTEECRSMWSDPLKRGRIWHETEITLLLMENKETIDKAFEMKIKDPKTVFKKDNIGKLLGVNNGNN